MSSTTAHRVRRVAIAAAAAAALLSGCGNSAAPGPAGAALPASDGSGATSAATGGAERQVSGFTGVELATPGDLKISRTGTESLTIEAAPDVLPLLTSEVVDGKLVLDTTEGAEFSTDQPIVYRLTVAELSDIALTGSGDITAGDIETDVLSVDLDGSGEITLGGTAREQRVTLSGSGDYDAQDLTTTTATVEVTGSGDATVTASDTLTVSITGSGSVTYGGDPAVTEDLSGSGEVRQQ